MLTTACKLGENKRDMILKTSIPVIVLFLIISFSISFCIIPLISAAPATETVTAPFTDGINAVSTINQYIGTVLITVSGTGQAAGEQWSDAFYVFANEAGEEFTGPPGLGIDTGGPWHTAAAWVLTINEKPAEDFIQGGVVPAYSASHEYSFQINVPELTVLTFGVGDGNGGDNTGSYVITVTSVPDFAVPESSLGTLIAIIATSAAFVTFRIKSAKNTGKYKK
jgi:hypothetical protein